MMAEFLYSGKAFAAKFVSNYNASQTSVARKTKLLKNILIHPDSDSGVECKILSGCLVLGVSSNEPNSSVMNYI